MLDADMWDLPPIDYLIVNYVKGDIKSYKAQHVEELSLKKDDIIVDIIELENGWWQVD